MSATHGATTVQAHSTTATTPPNQPQPANPATKKNILLFCSPNAACLHFIGAKTKDVDPRFLNIVIIFVPNKSVLYQ